MPLQQLRNREFLPHNDLKTNQRIQTTRVYVPTLSGNDGHPKQLHNSIESRKYSTYPKAVPYLDDMGKSIFSENG